MKPVVYTCPFVPAEWIAAHGLQPNRIAPRAEVPPHPPVGPLPGLCPYARAYVNRVLGRTDAAAVIVTTVCDQMRRAADMLTSLSGGTPVFLMNVPAIWQTSEAQRLYRRELQRLGRFLIEIGGEAASSGTLASVMRAHDAARAAIRAGRERLSPRRFSERIAIFHRQGGRIPAPHHHELPCDGIRLVLVGGPLRYGDFGLFDVIERAGGTVVLDATETGERTLPASFDDHALREDPLGELVRSYFGSIPDVSRRPNTRLFHWLEEQAAERGARGIICRRYVWCDSWHAEVPRLRTHPGLPLLDLDIDDDGAGANERAAGRIEAFVEMLKGKAPT